MLLKSAIRYILFRKAEQLGLFDIPVPIKPYVRDGKVIAGHVAKRKKRIAPKGKQPDLFGAAEPQGEAVKLGRLGHFIEKHGGYGRLHAMLQGYTDDQRNTLLDSMAKLAGKTRAEVVDILANGAKHEAPKAIEGDLFDQPEPLRFEYPSLVDDEQRKKLEQWHANGAEPGRRPAERGIYLPGMSVGKLERLLQKDKLTTNDRESLKDYKYLLLAQPEDAAEKGFMDRIQADHGGFLVPKNKFWLTNIDAALEGKAEAEAPRQASPKDNQGRDLAAVKRTKEQEQQRAEAGRAASRAMHEATIKNAPLPDWTTVNGQEVLRSGDSKFVAAPRNGKRTAANFDVLDLDTNEHVLSLPKDEVYKWLHASAKTEFEEKHGYMPHEAGPKEGDTKTENGIEYRLQDGRWHRVTPEGDSEVGENNRKTLAVAGFASVETVDNADGTVSVYGTAVVRSQKYFATFNVKGAGSEAPTATIGKWETFTGKQVRGSANVTLENLMDDLQSAVINSFKKKPAFTPTHELPDGTQVIAHADEANVWVDAQGDEYESEEAYPLSPQDPVRDTAREKLDTAKEAGVITPDEHQAASEALDSEGPAAAKQDDDAHAQIADKAIESVNTLVMARKEQARGGDMHTLPYVNAVQKAIEFLERKGDTQNAQRIRDAIAQGEKEAGRSLLDDNPQEGERNAEGLVFHDGRWRREDDPEARTAAIDDQLDAEEAQRLNPPETTPEPTPEPTRPDPLERLRAQIEAMGGKAQVAENLRMAFKDRLTRPQAEAVINELADATGLDRDTVLAEMGIKEVTRKPAGERTRPDTLSTGGEYTDDDPNSPNYRFRDTGYIGDSRKELAAESIREHARNGQRLRATDIDWQEIEKNPRQAKELITKSNLFGKVDWEALKANGMEPATGFLIDRVYASIAPEPSADDAQARKDYAVGLETLRDRLESCKTPENVTEVLEELRDEYDGIIFNEREKAAYESAREIYQEISNRRWALKQELDALQQASHRITGKINTLSWQQEKRERRKWKRDPEVDAQIEALRPAQAAAIQAVQDWKDAHPEAEERYETQTGTDAQGNMHVRSRLTGELYQKEQAAYEVMQTIKAFSLSRNREENPLHRAWRLMGPKFLTVLKWRSGKNAFQGHVTSAKTGKITDWSWAEKQHVTAPKATAGKVRFQLRVAENFSRVGGRPVEVNSTDELKRRFGLRDVQSGNWVLTDPESAAFHVQHAAEALSDLSDLLGIPEDKLFVNGRVALAFGARGTGNAGFGGAARAHYERIHRVINLTKMGGGGALAHELFHAIDNLAKEAETGQPGDAEDFITDNPDLLPDGPLKQAVRGLRSAMLDGDKRLWQTLKYTANDARLAKHNLDRAAPSKMAAAIKDASDLESALLAIDGFYPNGWTSKRTEKQREEWRRIAAAWHGGMNPEGGKVQAKAGAPVSDFTYQAHLLDGGQYGKYWSTTREMAARAFQAWCEDRLSDQGRKNDYLSAFADNKHYKDPIFGDSKPFPEGRERERINAAIDDLVYALRESGTLRKAFELLAA